MALNYHNHSFHKKTYNLHHYRKRLLTLIMLSMDISYFENSVDPDQLASRKPADQELRCFLSVCKCMHVKTKIMKFK